MEKKYIADKTRKLFNIKKQQFKDYLKQGNNAQKLISGIGAIIISAQILSMYPKEKEVERISKISYGKQLKKNKDKTYTDELTNKETIKFIEKTEQYLPLSKEINDLKSKVDVEFKEITTEEEYESLDESKYTPEEIKKDIKNLKQYIKKIKENQENNNKNIQLDLKYPTDEVKKYYKLAEKVLKKDASVCNNTIAISPYYLPSLYFNTVMSAYLQKAGLSLEDEYNRLIYEYIPETGGYKIDLDVKRSRGDTRKIPYCKINVDNFNEEAKELDEEYEKICNSKKEIHSEYDEKRNSKVKKALNNAKLLFYYDYKIKNHGENEELVGTLSYKKMKKSR